MGRRYGRSRTTAVTPIPYTSTCSTYKLINRLAMDGTILLPDANELGWKETVRMNPMESAIVALRPTAPKNQSFEIPNVVRSINPSMPDNVTLLGPPGGYTNPQGNPVTLYNHKVNYGWEYVYHCHILGDEENDMMHSMVFAVAPRPPTDLKATLEGNSVELSWKDNSISETGFTIQRADDPSFNVGYYLQGRTERGNVHRYYDREGQELLLQGSG